MITNRRGDAAAAEPGNALSSGGGGSSPGALLFARTKSPTSTQMYQLVPVSSF